MQASLRGLPSMLDVGCLPRRADVNVPDPIRRRRRAMAEDEVQAQTMRERDGDI
jgi:hypothetical protein